MEANYVSATMFPKVGKQGNIDGKHVQARNNVYQFAQSLRVGVT